MPAPRKSASGPKSEVAKSKASRPEVHPLGEHLAELLNPALVEPKTQGSARVRRSAAAAGSRAPAPESHPRGLTGAAVTANSLKALLEEGDPNIRNRPPWLPHRPPRPDKSEGGRAFRVVSEFEPKGDQPQAIEELVKGVRAQERDQVLLGVTGSGKTFTMAKVIEATQRPALGSRAQQDAGRAALRRVQELLPRQRGRVFRLLLRLLPARSLRPAHRHLYREGIRHQRADRPHAPLGHARAARARRRHHRRLGLLHLRHRLGRDLYGHDLFPETRRQGRPAPARQGPGRAAIQARAGRRFLARAVPRARRHDRSLPRPLRGPRLAHRDVRRRDRVDRRVRSADGAEDAGPRIRQSLRQFALCDAAPDASAIDRGDEARAQSCAWTSSMRKGACSRRNGSSSAPCSIWKCWRRPAPAPASRTIRAISPAAGPASRRRPCSNICPTTRSSSPTRAMSRSRRSAACIAATIGARRRSPNTASACRHAWTIGRSGSRNGRRCGRRPCMSRRRPGTGRWSRRKAPSSSR